MKRIHWLLLAAVFLIAVLVWPSSNEPPAPSLPPERTITAGELYDAYTGNEMAAERDFANTPIRVTGEVISVSDGGSVILDTRAGPRVGVKMLPGVEGELIDLRPGQAFSADCQRTHYLFGIVIPHDCRPSP